MITEAHQADAIVRAGQADIVLLARAFLRDPYSPLHAAKALGAPAAIPKQYARGSVRDLCLYFGRFSGAGPRPARVPWTRFQFNGLRVLRTCGPSHGVPLRFPTNCLALRDRDRKSVALGEGALLG